MKRRKVNILDVCFSKGGISSIQKVLPEKVILITEGTTHYSRCFFKEKDKCSTANWYLKSYIKFLLKMLLIPERKEPERKGEGFKMVVPVIFPTWNMKVKHLSLYFSCGPVICHFHWFIKVFGSAIFFWRTAGEKAAADPTATLISSQAFGIKFLPSALGWNRRLLGDNKNRALANLND